MFRIAANASRPAVQLDAGYSSVTGEVNEIGVDQFVTAEPTPKMQSRRGWRRRRVRRDKR